MSDFQESGINFCFKSSWMILKYDDHVAHKKVENFLNQQRRLISLEYIMTNCIL